MAPPIDIRQVLAQHVPQFAGLSADALTALVAASTWRSLAPGDVLLREGDAATHLFVVECGLLAATVTRADGTARQVGWASRGDLIGEMSLFTGKPRSATVTARRHALLVAMPLDVGRRVLLSCEPVLASLSELMLERAREPERPARPGPALVACIALGTDELRRRTGELLAVAARERSRTVVTAAAIADALGTGAAEAGATPELARWLHDAEGQAGLTFLDATSGPDAWAAAARARADRILVFIDATDERALATLGASPGTLLDVVLLSNADAPPPSRTRGAHFVGGASGLGPLLDALAYELLEHADLRRFPMFADSSDDTLALVRDALRWRSVPRGAVLMHEDDEADAVYLIHAGRFRVVRKDEDGGERQLRELGPGDAVGELAALTGERRSATVFAVRDGIVGRLPLSELRRLLALRPSLGLGLARVVAEHMTRPSRIEPHRPPRTIAVLPLGNSAGISAFVRELADTLRALEVRAAVLDAPGADAAWGAGISSAQPGQAGDAALMTLFHHLEDERDVVILASDEKPSAWRDRCLRHADRVLLVVDARDSPELRPLERELFAADPRSAPSVHLALLQPAHIEEATGTARWLRPRPNVTHHHVRAGNAGDRGRLARRLTDRAIGVALAGASSRGYAHYGVIRGVLARGLPIDVVAGSSSGAASAATYTTGMDWPTAMERSLRAVEEMGFRASRVQPPLASVMSGAAASASCRRIFGDRCIEDMLIPGIYTAVDLNRHELVLLRTGPLWLAVRASTSLPLMWPPVWWGDRLLVDGGLISYVPVEAIMDECAGGVAIASDLDPDSDTVRAFEKHRRHGDTLSGWRLLAEHLNPFSTPAPYPTAGEVLFHTMCMKSFEQKERLSRSLRYRDVRVVQTKMTFDGYFGVDRATALACERRAFETTCDTLADLSLPVLPDERPDVPAPLSGR